MDTLRPTGHLQLKDVIGEYHLAGLAAGPDGEPILLARDSPFERSAAVKPPCDYRLYRGGARPRTLELRTTQVFYKAAGLSDGRWLLAGMPLPGTSDTASIYSGRGELLHSFSIGQAFNHVQTTGTDEIWVGYFDEGVFDDAPQLSNNGLVCLDSRGEPLLEYLQFARENNLPPIDDCYALNVVSDDEVWLYYYDEFPLVKLKNRRLAQVWPDVPTFGTRGFAVWNDRVLFAGTYEGRTPDNPFNFFLVSLESNHVQELQPLDETGAPIESYGLVAVRGPRLFVHCDDTIYWFDMRDLASQIHSPAG